MALISIVLPVANRVNRQVLKNKQLEKMAAECLDHDFEFIFVDDGSHHDSISRLEALTREDKRYRLVILTRDFGPTASFLAGISYASGDCAGFFPESNLDPSRIFAQLVQKWESGAKIVLGKWAETESSTRTGRGIVLSDPLLKRRFFPNRIFFQDINSFLVDRDVLFVLSQISDPFSDMIELLAWVGIEPHLVEYEQTSIPDGSTEIKFHQRTISLNYTEGLFSLRTLRRSLWAGFLLGAVGVVLTAALILMSEIFQVIIPDWWMLVGVVFFMLGMQLILMGTFGEQIYRSLEKIRSRPAFVVESVLNPPVSASSEGREKVEKMILSLWNTRKQKIAYAASRDAGVPEEKDQSR